MLVISVHLVSHSLVLSGRLECQLTVSHTQTCPPFSCTSDKPLNRRAAVKTVQTTQVEMREKRVPNYIFYIEPFIELPDYCGCMEYIYTICISLRLLSSLF